MNPEFTPIEEFPPPPPPPTSCARCDDLFYDEDMARTSEGEYWHLSCFVCAHCLRPFMDHEYYEFRGQKYCRQDYQTLFAPYCHKCGQCIMSGKYIKTKGIKSINSIKTYHINCFECDLCHRSLTNHEFTRFKDLNLCNNCTGYTNGLTIK